MNGRAVFGAALGFAALVSGSGAWADVDIGPVIAHACAGAGSHVIKRERLAEALLAQEGVFATDLSPREGQESVGQLAIEEVRRRRDKPSDASDPEAQTNNEVKQLVQRLQQLLASGKDPKAVGLQVDNPRKGGGDWLFAEERPDQLRCLKDGAKPKTTIEQLEALKTDSRFSIRGKVDDFGLSGDDLKKADSAKLGLTRTRTKQDDGTFKTDTTATFDGAVGFRLSDDPALPVYLYGSYSLSRERVHPPPKLDPGKAQGDGDTNVLEAGITLSSLLLHSSPRISWTLDSQLAEVSDFVHDSERLKFRAAVTPGLPISLGPFCDLGGFNGGRDAPFRVRCRVTGEFEASHVFRAGTGQFNNHGNFFSLGPAAGFDLAAPMGDDAEIIWTVDYRYLPTIAGRAPDVKRLDEAIKYRIWLKNGLGVDLGLTYAKGLETKSYTHEDKLVLGFGLIY